MSYVEAIYNGVRFDVILFLDDDYTRAIGARRVGIAERCDRAGIDRRYGTFLTEIAALTAFPLNPPTSETNDGDLRMHLYLIVMFIILPVLKYLRLVT